MKTHAAFDPYGNGDLRARCNGAPKQAFATSRETVTCKRCRSKLDVVTFVAVAAKVAKPYKPEVTARLAKLAGKAAL